MSTSGFSFPPPPPPPPRRSHDDYPPSFRGRSDGSGSFRGRGASRGAFPQRANFGPGRGRGNRHSGHPNFSTSRSPHSPPNFSPPSKRDHATAFSDKPNSRAQAPAAVPSFNASIENLLAQKPQPSAAPKPLQKKPNLLGLTPSTADASDSEDDKDEEARLADAATSHDLQFEYKGKTSMLRTTAEIAAWLAERKKRWPTEARREAAKKEEEERKRKWREEKQKKADIFQAAKQKRTEQRQQNISKAGSTKTKMSHNDKGSESVQTAQLRTEHLRRKAAKAQRALEKAERDLLRSRPSLRPDDNEVQPIHNAEPAGTDDDSSSLSDSSDLTESGSDTSSASDSEDSGPEESSSKVEVEKLSAPSEKYTEMKMPCRAFAKHGNCKYGRRCKYAHDPGPAPSRNAASSSSSKTGRKGLWQVMTEKEREEETKKVLSAIIALGKQGMLDGDP